MNYIKPGAVAYFTFPTQDTSGAAITAASISLICRRNGAIDAGVIVGAGLTVAAASGYAAVALTVPGSYAAGDFIEVLARLTVSGIVGAYVPVWRGEVSLVKLADLSTAVTNVQTSVTAVVQATDTLEATNVAVAAALTALQTSTNNLATIAAWTENAVDEIAERLPSDPASQGAVELALSNQFSDTVDELLAELRGAGDLLFNPLTKDAGGAPVPSAAVTIRRGAVVIAQGVTDASGRVRWGDLFGFVLEADTYTVIVRALGKVGIAGAVLELEADAAPVYQLAAVPVPISENPDEVLITLNFWPWGDGRPGLPFEVKIVGYQSEFADVLGAQLLANYERSFEAEANQTKSFFALPSSKLMAAGLPGAYEVSYYAGDIPKRRLFRVSDAGAVTFQKVIKTSC